MWLSNCPNTISWKDPSFTVEWTWHPLLKSVGRRCMDWCRFLKVLWCKTLSLGGWTGNTWELIVLHLQFVRLILFFKKKTQKLGNLYILNSFLLIMKVSVRKMAPVFYSGVAFSPNERASHLGCKRNRGLRGKPGIVCVHETRSCYARSAGMVLKRRHALLLLFTAPPSLLSSASVKYSSWIWTWLDVWWFQELLLLVW